MSLPEQLQKQVEQAQTILDKHYGTGDEAASGVPGGNQQPETVATVKAPAAPVVETTHSARQEVTPAEDENSPTFAQRWRSLQGVYQGVVQKNNQLEGKVAQLENLISTMSQAAPAAGQEERRFLTEKDNEDFGEDMVDFAKRAVAEATAPLQDHIRALQEQLHRVQSVVPTVSQLANQQAQTQEARFFGALNQVVPDWESVNTNQKFLNWLLSPDPMTGINRQTYLEDAQRAQDVNRVAAIFNLWKEQSGTTAQASVQTKPNSVRSELERQVAPGRASAAVTTPNAEADRQYTPHDITKFYDDVRRGVYKGREAERDALERDIFVAQREGRIVRSAA